MNTTSPNFIYFGTPEESVLVLDILEAQELRPSCVVTKPDARAGRKKTMTPPPVKVWAENRNVPVLQPSKLDSDFERSILGYTPQVFVVFAYGKIIPQSVLDIPSHGTLNIHPSLLPKHRGPSPIRSAILSDEKENGVSIILLDKKMDHGPILIQKKYAIEDWPPSAPWLYTYFAQKGGELLAEILPKWVNGEIEPVEQNHEEATYCKMIEKGDALIDLNDDPYQNFLKIKAYEGWPRAYYMNNGTRIIITEASFNNGYLEIQRVIPEGKKETTYEQFLNTQQ